MREYLPPQQFLKECFHYNPNTGRLTWQRRPDSHFSAPHHAKAWNTQFAGTPASWLNEEGYRRVEIRYAGRKVRGRAARVIFKLMTGAEPPQIDHRDCNPSNDRWSNLRAATQSQNLANRPVRVGKTLPKGVYFAENRYCAAIGRRKLGRFVNLADAVAARAAAVAEVQGEFAHGAGPSIFD